MPQRGSPYTARHTAVASSDSRAVERQSNGSWTSVGLQSRRVESWLKLQPQQSSAIVCYFNTFLLKRLQSFKLRKFQYKQFILTIPGLILVAICRDIDHSSPSVLSLRTKILISMRQPVHTNVLAELEEIEIEFWMLNTSDLSKLISSSSLIRRRWRLGLRWALFRSSSPLIGPL